mmetsp:Transcript_31203/g.79447  ORF Transcript_31203/g.79447 Transcript_31203/m.79447 type:complete len:360 (-) Transcript_31203:134-1213(-)
MESGGPDGASEASYESVASEGGYEPASERGRDPLPRIISSSHCVEVFRRLRWADGAYSCHDSTDEDTNSAKAGGRKGAQLRPHNPLSGLPPRIMHFDGAMEAWLEEMLMPAEPHHGGPRQYETLDDAAKRNQSRDDMALLSLGNRRATIWYFTLEFLQQLWPHFLNTDESGVKLWERALLDRGCNIQSTHIEVGQVNYPQAKNAKARTQWLKAVFSSMQASKWTPNGEARALLVKRRLSHASMSIGDAIQIGSELFVAGLDGFVAVSESERLVPPNYEPNEGPTPSIEEPSETPPSKKKGGGGGAGKKGKGRGGKGKGKGKGGENGDAKKPAPGGKTERADRRQLRAQLQAKREQMEAH